MVGREVGEGKEGEGGRECMSEGRHACRQAGSERKAGRQRVVCYLRALFGNMFLFRLTYWKIISPVRMVACQLMVHQIFL